MASESQQCVDVLIQGMVTPRAGRVSRLDVLSYRAQKVAMQEFVYVVAHNCLQVSRNRAPVPLILTSQFLISKVCVF